MSLLDKSHFLIVLSRRIIKRKIAADHSSLDNNFSFMGSKPFCNVLMYSKALNYFSHWSSSQIPAAKKASHTMTALLSCFAVRKMHPLLYFSADLFKTPLCSITSNSCFIAIHHSTQLSIFCQKKHYSAFDVFLKQQWLFK